MENVLFWGLWLLLGIFSDALYFGGITRKWTRDKPHWQRTYEDVRERMCSIVHFHDAMNGPHQTTSNVGNALHKPSLSTQILRTADVFLSLQRFAKTRRIHWEICLEHFMAVFIADHELINDRDFGVSSGRFYSLQWFIIFWSDLRFNDSLLPIIYSFISLIKNSRSG